MKEALNFFRKLFEYEDYTAAFLQSDSTSIFHGWFYIISDLLVWSAYFVIFLHILFYTVNKGRSIRLNRSYMLFGAFILCCGAMFFADAVMFILPMYRFNALIKFITGIISWVTVFHLIKYLPKTATLKTSKELEEEIKTRTQIELELKLKNERLQEAERLARIGYINWNISNDSIEFSDTVHEILGIDKMQTLNYELISKIIHEEDSYQIEQTKHEIFNNKSFPNFYCRINVPGVGVKELLVMGQIKTGPDGAVQEVKGTIQDMTEQRRYLHHIQMQNQRLKDIAWIQSHKVRGPLASIMGLVPLFNTENPADPVNKEILEGVAKAAQSLDNVIKEINAKTGSTPVAKPVDGQFF